MKIKGFKQKLMGNSEFREAYENPSIWERIKLWWFEFRIRLSSQGKEE